MIGGHVLSELKIGDMIETTYNSGTYLGKVIEFRGNFILTETFAVLKHPMQGDLHQRGAVEGVAFHERKALAHGEKFNARKRMSKLYSGEIPEYAASLKASVQAYKAELESEETLFNQKSLEKIQDLEKDFYHKIYS